MDNENNRSFMEKARLFAKEKAMYLVLLGCLAVAGVTAFVAFSSARVPEEGAPVQQSQDQMLSEMLLAPTPTVAPATPSPTPEPSIEPEQKVTETSSAVAEPKNSDLLFAPVEGSLMTEFAGDSLLYSRTLKQWAAHKGIDIAAAEGTAVRAVADGVVSEVKNDPMLGYTISVKHDGNMTSIYANLDSLPTLKTGESVKAGAQLGAVGQTAITEIADDPHLHFELVIDGQAVDPMPYLKGLVSIPVK